MPDSPAQKLPLSVLTGMALSVGLAPFNSTLIAVALPDIGAELGVPGSALTQWLVSGYLLACVAFQSPAGKFGDLWGHHRAIRIGRWLFVLGALLGGLLPLLPALVVARVMMALGGAMLVPPSMALLRILVPVDRRGQVFGLLASVIALSAALGPLVGGWLTENFGWRFVFWINLPLVGASLLMASSSALPKTLSSVGKRPAFDLLGSVLLATGLVAGVVALRVPGLTLALLGLAGALLVAFFLVEQRAAAPVLDVRIFRQRNYSLGVAIAALQNFGLYGVLFQLPYLYAELFPTAPTQVAIALLGLMGGMVVVSPLGGWLADRLGAGFTIFLGSSFALAGLLLLSLPEYWPSPVGLLPVLLLIGTGIGFSTGPSQAVALSVIAPQESGMASGALAMLRYLGSMSSAVAIGVFMGMASDSLTERYSLSFRLYSIAFVVSALLALFLAGKKTDP